MRRPAWWIAAMVVSLSLAGGCGGLKIDRPLLPRADDWLMFGGNPGRTNSTMMTLRPPLLEKWRYDGPAGIKGQPLVRDSVVFVATLNGEIQAIHLGSGARIGRKTLGVPFAGSMVLDGNTVIAAGALGEESVVAYDLTTGKTAWKDSLGPIETSPVLDKGRIFIATLKGTLCSLDARDGTVFWKTETANGEDQQNPIRSSPALAGGILVCGTDAGALVAADTQTGRLLWQTDLGSSIFSSPVTLDDRILVGTVGGIFWAVSPRDGKVLWRYDAGSPIYGSAAAANGRAYVGSADGVLHAVRIDSGKAVWRFATKSVINSAPFVSGEVLYVGSLDRKIYALSASTGERLWDADAAGRIKTSPVQWGSTLLVTSEDKSITAFVQEP